MTEEERFQRLRCIEALLFASPEPVAEKLLAAQLAEGEELAPLLEELQATYAGRGVELRQIGTAWAFRTAVDVSESLTVERQRGRRLNRPAMETLAIIAYHQPVTRAEIEEIRGVSLSRGSLDTLLEAGWVAPRGRRRVPGRPVTWGTTAGFLDHFGLENLGALPGREELKAAGLLTKAPALAAVSGQVPLPFGEEEAEGEVQAPAMDQGDEEPLEAVDPESLRSILDEAFGKRAEAEAAENESEESGAEESGAEESRAAGQA